MIIKIGIPILAAFALGFAVSTTALLIPEAQLTSPIYPPAVSTLGESTIAGLGVVEPRSERIAIGTPLSGIVARVHVVAGQKVKKDDPLFRLDDREGRAELNARQKALELEEAKLTRLRAEPRAEDVPPAWHRLEVARVNAERARDALERIQRITSGRAVSVEDVQARRFAALAATAELAQAQAELARLKAGAWKYDIAVADREVALARAAVERVRVDLDRLTVRAPVDGIVFGTNVRAGEFATAGPAGDPLVTLGDDGPLRVRAQIDEEDAGRVVPGQQAEGFVRGRVRHRLDLRFVRIEPNVVPKQFLSGSTTERVDTRVLMVIYEITSTDEPVYVGQQVDVFLRVPHPRQDPDVSALTPEW
jgi:HlyD family secretion protein